MSNNQGPNSGWCQKGRFENNSSRNAVNECKERALPDKSYCELHHQQAIMRVAKVRRRSDRAISGRQVLLSSVSEERWLQQIIVWAKRAGWMTYHTRDSRRSTAGFPDLVLVKSGHPVIFVEAKTIKGRISEMQRVWLDELRMCPGSLVFIWRPDDEASVKRALELRFEEQGA